MVTRDAGEHIIFDMLQKLKHGGPQAATVFKGFGQEVQVNVVTYLQKPDGDLHAVGAWYCRFWCGGPVETTKTPCPYRKYKTFCGVTEMAVAVSKRSEKRTSGGNKDGESQMPAWSWPQHERLRLTRRSSPLGLRLYCVGTAISATTTFYVTFSVAVGSSPTPPAPMRETNAPRIAPRMHRALVFGWRFTYFWQIFRVAGMQWLRG